MERENFAPFRVTSLQRFYVQLQTPNCNNPSVAVIEEAEVEVSEEVIEDVPATDEADAPAADEAAESGE